MKRRFAKRRTVIGSDLRDWDMTLRFGRDYLHDLARYGIQTDEQAQTEAKAAWQRLGAEFMRRWEPNSTRKLPWAYEQFGAPDGGRHAG